MILTFRAAQTRSEHEHDLATYVAWRTADLMRAKRMPRLTRLLRKVKRLSEAEQDKVRAAMVDAEAYWARIDAQAAEARAKKEASADGR